MENAARQTNQRMASIDVYRGFVMLLMMGEVLSFGKMAKAFPESRFWQFLDYHQSHVEWVGCSLHDMIQPSFSFLVGVALPYSIANRLAKGESYNKMYAHALRRSLVLIFLGIFLRYMHAHGAYITFEDTLTQIGLGYFFLFILGFKSLKTQIVALMVILVGYFVAFAGYPLPDATFDYSQTGVTANWAHNQTGFAAHWNKNTNLAWAFDRWFLNLFPRVSPFLYNGGGYATLSFIPTLGTMILGLLAGQELKSSSRQNEKLKKFLLWGLSLLVVGWLLNALNICPNVKRIWTPSWTLYSGGACFLFLAFFYATIDVLKTSKWYFPFIVVGANSIVAYIIAHTIDSYIAKFFSQYVGTFYNNLFGVAYQPLVNGFLVLLVEWLILLFLYRKRIFIKI